MGYQDVFVALADPTRLSIFESLRASPQTVGQLAAAQPVSRPAVSQHLRVLEGARLVQVEPRGNRRLYSVRREGLAEVRRYLDTFWDEVLGAYAAEVSRRTTKERRRTS